MATIQQAQQQIHARRQAIETAKQRVLSSSFTQRQKTQRELRARGRDTALQQLQARRKEEERKRVVRKKALSQISLAEKETEKFQKKIQTAKKTPAYYLKQKLARGEEVPFEEVKKGFRGGDGILSASIGKKYQTPYGEIVLYDDPESIASEFGDIAEFQQKQFEKIQELAPTELESRLKMSLVSPEDLKMSPDQLSEKDYKFYYDEKGLPRREVQPAPKLKEQYKKFVKDKGFVSGSLEFLGEKASGQAQKLARAERKVISGQSLPGALAESGALSKTIQYAPYLVPYLGEVLLVGSGAEALGTKAGRERIKEFGKYAEEEFGIPKGLGAPAGVGIAGASIFIGGKGLKTRLTAPRNILIEPVPKTQWISRDVIQPIIKGEQQGALAKFQMKGYTPPRSMQYTTRFKQLTGQKPTTKIISPERTEIVFSDPFLIKDGKIVDKAFTYSRRRGAQLTQVSQLRGAQKQFTLGTYNQLPQTQRYALRKIAEQRLGRPVPYSQVPEVLGKGFDYSRGYLESERILRLSPRSEYQIQILRPGRRITRGDVVSRGKLLVKTPTAEFWKTTTRIKTSKKALPRATGKAEEIKGFTLIKKQISIDTGEGINYFGGKVLTKQKQIPKTTWDKTLQTLQEAKGVTAKGLARPPRPSKVLQKLEEKAVTTRAPPQSLYYGKGMYERTEQPSYLGEILKPVQREDVLIKQTPRLAVDLITGQKIKQTQKQILKFNEVIKQPTRARELIKQIPKYKTLLKTPSRQISRTRLIQRPTTTPKQPTTPYRPRTLPPTIPKLFRGKPSKAKGKLKKGEELFIAETKRYGRWLEIGKYKEFGKAFRKGLGRVKQTLGASLRIRKGSKILPIAKETRFFRPSKVDRRVLVQRAKGVPGARLRSIGERREIQRAKKKFKWF